MLFRNGKTWDQFLDGVSTQRELWMSTEAAVSVQPEFIERVSAARKGLQIIVGAEDWCPRFGVRDTVRRPAGARRRSAAASCGPGCG